MAQRTMKSGKSNKRASLECDEEHKHRNAVTYKKVVATSNVYHQTDEYKKEKSSRKKYRGCLIRSKNTTNTTSITEEVILEEQKKCKATPQQ